MTARKRPDGMSHQLYRMILAREAAVLKAKLRRRDSGPGVQEFQRPPPLIRLDPIAQAVQEAIYSGYYSNT